MQEKIKKSVITAGILGLFLPTSSLLYVRREVLAVTLMALFLCSVFMLVHSPIGYFSTSLWIVLSIQIIIWSASFVLGIWYAWKGVSIEIMLKDQGHWLVTYAVLFFVGITQMSSIPVGLFVVHDTYLGFDKNDIIIVQKKPTVKYLRASDYVVFLDENYKDTIGQLVALPGDVLDYKENGYIGCNDELYKFSLNLPSEPWIIPNNIMLIYSDDHILNEDGSPNIHAEKDGNMSKKDSLVKILPVQRIKGKALYILFSTDTSNIGKSLTDNVFWE